VRVLLVGIVAVIASAALPPWPAREGSASLRGATTSMRVCADPNNLPFSNEHRQGFENRLAEMIATDAGTSVSYTWWPQRRGFVRNTVDSGACDVIMGVPVDLDRVETTRPYYRSTYVFVAARYRHLGLHSFDDPRLRQLKIGVQMIGDDFANTPPAHALSSRGYVQNIVGYSVLGDYSQPNPPARIVEAVARGDVDAAVVWGPLAGYFAARERVPLDVTPVSPQADSPARPFVFDIAMAVRRGDDVRRAALDAFIARHEVAIDRLLDQYDVPRLPLKGAR